MSQEHITPEFIVLRGNLGQLSNQHYQMLGELGIHAERHYKNESTPYNLELASLKAVQNEGQATDYLIVGQDFRYCSVLAGMNPATGTRTFNAIAQSGEVIQSQAQSKGLGPQTGISYNWLARADKRTLLDMPLVGPMMIELAQSVLKAKNEQIEQSHNRPNGQSA